MFFAFVWCVLPQMKIKEGRFFRKNLPSLEVALTRPCSFTETGEQQSPNQNQRSQRFKSLRRQ
jgi:hypothetical protein